MKTIVNYRKRKRSLTLLVAINENHTLSDEFSLLLIVYKFVLPNKFRYHNIVLNVFKEINFVIYTAAEENLCIPSKKISKFKYYEKWIE